MRKFTLLCASLCSIAMLFATGPARAQSVLWVAATGNDANNCAQTSPCGTFQGAINKGGVAQVRCLTSGNYGPFTITESITIDCGTGNTGTVSVSAGSAAIIINTSSAATVVLRHLSLNGNTEIAFGILANTFASGTLVVEDCTIQGFNSGGTIGNGILFAPSAGRGLLQVSDSRIFNNGNGIVVDPASGQIASVALNRVESTGNSATGVVLEGNGVVAGTMRDSLVGGNGNSGVDALATQVFLRSRSRASSPI
jgi:hypothetical protein